ncbi:hypothetical protein I5677_00765 [Mobilitalea sibirica]|uniref:Uncharacterized protein n=1 Tax=Mobilitalea sibirica TaxID=1462919 RepID=A0A8J7H087_9FIRM|nr:hypothetical protein [Mobilitalea sibirica]MBH1939419.1 hypothetical protein [Mobilitalea sibirica]
MNQQTDMREDRFDKFVFYACVIDCMFLPYVWFISIPYTLPLLYLWVIRRYHNIAVLKEFKVFAAMFFIMLFSTMLGLITAPQHLYRNLVYLLLFTSMFLYYFLFSYYLRTNASFQLKKILIIFMIFVVALAVIYNLDKALYQEFKLLWNRRSGISINETLYEGYVGYRYAFIWMDANNIAYMMNALLLYLWCNEKTSLLLKVCSVLSLFFILISCMSSGGLVSFIVAMFLYLLIKLQDMFQKKKRKEKFLLHPLDLFLYVALLLSLILILPRIPRFMETSVALEAMERFRNNSGESRFLIWEYILDNVNFFEYILFGRGGVTLINKMEYPPHNGHFYWILAYGFISYLQFMYLVFRKRKGTSFRRYVWIVPIFIGFTINVMLGEIKMMGIVLLLVVCTVVGKNNRADVPITSRDTES